MTRATPGIVQITPFIFARDISASAAFYQSIGFLPTHVNPDHKHACCEGHGHARHLLEISSEAELGEQMIYLDMNEIDAFHDTLRPVPEALPEGRAGPPFDQSYGQRELHVSEPDNCLLLFGSEPQRRTDAA